MVGGIRPHRQLQAERVFRTATFQTRQQQHNILEVLIVTTIGTAVKLLM